MSAGTCPSYYVRKKTKKDTSKGSSCPVAVGYAIKELWEEFQGKELKPKDTEEEKIQEEVNAPNAHSKSYAGKKLIWVITKLAMNS